MSPTFHLDAVSALFSFWAWPLERKFTRQMRIQPVDPKRNYVAY